jgi:asparagine synthetase B (glutamine-hydrolysing)
MELIDIKSFLRFGYSLNYKNHGDKLSFDQVSKDLYKNCSEEDLIQVGVKKLTQAIQNNFELGKKNVIPLSGGLDSRAILAAMMEFTEAKNIHTYTFGTPGSLDYEIGNKVAKKLGTNHSSFPLTEFKYNMDELLNISKRVDFQTVLFHHPPVSKVDQIFGDGVIWSGFMGDPLAGGHLSKNNFDNLDEEKSSFIKKNTYVKSIELDQTSEDAFFHYIEIPEPRHSDITIQEQLDFYNRQLKFIAPHVLIQGYQYKVPFLDEEWSNFILSVEDHLRFNQYLHKKILVRAFPDAFNYPTKTNRGAKLDAHELTIYWYKVKNKIKNKLSQSVFRIQDPYINYIDFNSAIRDREDLRTIIHENIMDLKSRNIIEFTDFDKIWKNHIDKTANHADALIVLASLEINIKSRRL